MMKVFLSTVIIGLLLLFSFFSNSALALEPSLIESLEENGIDIEQPLESLSVAQFLTLQQSEQAARLPEGLYSEEELRELLKDVKVVKKEPLSVEKTVLCIEKDVYSPPRKFPLPSKVEQPSFKRKTVCYEQPV